MKNKQEHLQALRAGIAEVVSLRPNIRADYRNFELSEKRLRWDLLYASQIGELSGVEYICKVLYPYLDDGHIDTALRAIVFELLGSEPHSVIQSSPEEREYSAKYWENRAKLVPQSGVNKD